MKMVTFKVEFELLSDVLDPKILSKFFDAVRDILEDVDEIRNPMPEVSWKEYESESEEDE